MNVSGPTTIASMASRPRNPWGATLSSIFNVECRLPSELMALVAALDGKSCQRPGEAARLGI